MPSSQLKTRGDDRRNISSGGAFEAVFGYSRAVRVNDHVHVSGTCAPALVDAGATWSDVVRTVVYVKDINEAANVAGAHVEIFGAIRPASTLVQVDGFMRPWQQVEIEAYAIVAH